MWCLTFFIKQVVVKQKPMALQEWTEHKQTDPYDERSHYGYAYLFR